MNVDVSKKRSNFVFRVELNENNLWLNNTDKCSYLHATVRLHPYFDSKDGEGGGYMFLPNVRIQLQLHGFTAKKTII